MERLPQTEAYREKFIDLLSIAVELCVITGEEAIEKYNRKKDENPDWPEF